MRIHTSAQSPISALPALPTLPTRINSATQSSFTLQSHIPTRSTKSNSVQSTHPRYPTPYPQKLYTPTIYDTLTRLHNTRKNSQYTLCSALHIYQQYCQTMKDKLGANEDMADGMGYSSQMEDEDMEDDPWHGEIIAEICYEISQDINQCQNKRKCKSGFNLPQKYHHNSRYKTNYPPYSTSNKNQPGHSPTTLKQKKFQILTALDWRIHYTTFIDLTHEFFHNYQATLLQYLGKNWQVGLCRKRVYESREKQLEEVIENEIQIVLEQWVFLEKQAMDCARVTIERVLGNFGLRVDSEELLRFMNAEVQKLVINITENDDKLQQNNESSKYSDLQMQNLQMLKQVNRVNSFMTSSTSSYLSSISNHTQSSESIQKNNQMKTPAKLMQFRSKITHGQRTQQYFKPTFTFTQPSSPSSRVLPFSSSSSFEATFTTNKQNKSEPSTRHPSFQ